MFARISNSWALVKASAAVLQADKELIVFPIVSSIALLLVSLTFAVPFFLSGAMDAILAGGSEFFGYLVLFVFYLVQYFVIIFANTALVGATLIRLGGGDPTLADGFRIAWERIGTILGYALLSATVGIILRWFSERNNFLSRIAASFIGLAWTLATFLAVPVFVVEDVGPLEAVKRSALLLKRTWGEQIVGNFSISLVFGLVTFAVILLDILVVVVALSANMLWLIIVVGVLSVLLFIGLGFLSSTLSGIYTAAVYQYAMGSSSSEFFSTEMVTNAFRKK
jgi:hypothetical protein